MAAYKRSVLINNARKIIRREYSIEKSKEFYNCMQLLTIHNWNCNCAKILCIIFQFFQSCATHFRFHRYNFCCGICGNYKTYEAAVV